MGAAASKQEKVQPTLETIPEKGQHAEIMVSEKTGADTTTTSERAQSLDSEDVSVKTNSLKLGHLPSIMHKNVFITSLFNNVPPTLSAGIFPWLVEGIKPP